MKKTIKKFILINKRDVQTLLDQAEKLGIETIDKEIIISLLKAGKIKRPQNMEDMEEEFSRNYLFSKRIIRYVLG